MAIFHCQAKAISRASGRSATASAAYRACDKIKDARTGEIHDYTRKTNLEFSEIVTPDSSNIDRSTLWNAAELAEKRKDAKVAREWELALPSELSANERKKLSHDFARALADRYGVAADVCIHAPSREGDQRNHHAHILTTTRTFAAGQLGKKTRILDSPKTSGREVEIMRTAWADMVNKALERAGHAVRIDHRSLAAQGIDRAPTHHLGPAVTAMERRGIRTERGDLNRMQSKEKGIQAALTQAEQIQTGAARIRKQAQEWRIAKERAKEREKALAAERAKQQERERQEAERKAQEEKERIAQERREKNQSRGPSLGR